MPISIITIIGVLVAAVVRTGLGALWYSPLLFGRAWMKSMGMDPENLPSGGSGREILLSALGSLVLAIGMAVLIRINIGEFSVDTVWDALLAGLLASVFFNLTTFLTHAPFEGRGFPNALISYGYDMTGYLLMSVILFFLCF